MACHKVASGYHLQCNPFNGTLLSSQLSSGLLCHLEIEDDGGIGDVKRKILGSGQGGTDSKQSYPYKDKSGHP